MYGFDSMRSYPASTKRFPKHIGLHEYKWLLMSLGFHSMVMFSQGTTKMHKPPGFSLGNNAFSSSSGLRVCSRALLEIIKSAILSGTSTAEEKTSTPFFAASVAATSFTSVPICVLLQSHRGDILHRNQNL